MRDLTPRQREVLAVIIEAAELRTCAQTLSIAYQGVLSHLAEIKKRLDLPNICVRFNALPIGAKFKYNGVTFTRVPHATDRFGGYNAQDSTGQRHMFMKHIMVQRLEGRQNET
jgi:hypothetical protein